MRAPVIRSVSRAQVADLSVDHAGFVQQYRARALSPSRIGTDRSDRGIAEGVGNIAALVARSYFKRPPACSIAARTTCVAQHRGARRSAV